MITTAMLIALSLNPLESNVSNLLPVPSTPIPTPLTKIVLDNFDDGETSLFLPTPQGMPLLDTKSGLKGVLNGVRYLSVSVDGCDKDPLYCADVRINSRKSGVLSVAYSQLLPDHVGEVRVSYQVNIDDLREYTFSIGDLDLDETAKDNLLISVIVNGIEYPIDKETLSYDFFNVTGGDAINVKSFEVKFTSRTADDFTVDNLELSRKPNIVPKPVPAMGSNWLPVPAIAGVATLVASLDNGSSKSTPLVIEEEIITEVPPITELPPIEIPIELPTVDNPIVDSPTPVPPTEPVPEPTTILGTVLTGILGWIAKRRQG